MSQKVCILTSAHQVSSTRIFYRHAKALKQAGYRVVYIVQHNKSEVIDDIEIIPLPKPKCRFERMTKVVWGLFISALKEKADIYHFHDPELIPVGILLKFFGKKVIYDVHENFPDIALTRKWIKFQFARKIVSLMTHALETIGSFLFDAVVTATPKIAERFSASKTITVYNFPSLTELLNPSSVPYVERPKSFIYVGGIIKDRGAEEIVRAIELLDDIPGARLDLAGNISLGFADTLKSFPGWNLVNYHGHVARKELAQLLGNARAGLVLPHSVPNLVDSLPVKMFEYMAAGLPVIGSDFLSLRQVVEGTGCGLIVDPLDIKAIEKAMRWILDHSAEAELMGQRGCQAAKRIYNWDAEAKKLVALYKKLLDL